MISFHNFLAIVISSFGFFLNFISAETLTNQSEFTISGNIYSVHTYYYAINSDAPSTFLFSSMGITYSDSSYLTARYSCDPDCTSGNQAAYCKSSSSNSYSNVLVFNSQGSCNIEVNVTIGYGNSGLLIKSRNFPVAPLQEYFLLSDFVNIYYNGAPIYFSLEIPTSAMPATLNILMNPKSSSDSGYVQVSGDCLCGNEEGLPWFTKKICYSSSVGTALIINLDKLEKSCVVYVEFFVSSFQSGFELSSSFETINQLTNKVEQQVVNSNFSKYFSFSLDAANVPAALYFVIKNNTQQYYATNDCGCYYNTKFPSQQSYCYISNTNILDMYLENSCTAYIKIPPGTYTIKIIMKYVTVFDGDVEMDIGFVDPDIRANNIYVYFIHNTKFTAANSLYIMVEGKTSEDRSDIYVNNQNAAKCNYLNRTFPNSYYNCLYSQTQNVQNNFLQVNSEVPQIIAIGIRIDYILQGFTLKLKNWLVLTLKNNTNFALPSISSIKNYSPKLYMNYEIPKNISKSALYIYLMGQSASDNSATVYLNFDCLSSCPYRNFPGNDAGYCYSKGMSDQNLVVDQYFSTSCMVYITVAITSYNLGLNLTVINLPKFYLQNQQPYVFNHFGLPVKQKGMYLYFYFAVLSQYGPVTITIAYNGLTASDNAYIFLSGEYFCTPFNEFPFQCNYYYCTPNYCSAAYNSGKTTSMQISITESVNTNLTFGVYLLSYYQGGIVSVTMNQACLSNSSNFCTQCELTSNGKSMCTRCLSQYILDSSSLCQPCDKSEGHYLDATLNQCNQCMPNCKNCTNSNSCITCAAGYIYDNQTQQCICSTSNLPYCAQCSYNLSNTAVCVGCIQGFGLNNGSCYNLSTDSNFYIQQTIINQLTQLTIYWTNVNSSIDVFQYVFFSIQSPTTYQNQVTLNQNCNSEIAENSLNFQGNQTSKWVTLKLDDLISCGFTTSDNITWQGLIIYFNTNKNQGYATLLKVNYQPNEYGQLVLRDQSDTLDGTNLVFHNFQQDPKVSNQIQSIGEQLQLSFIDTSGNNYSYSIQGNATFQSQIVIKSTCNSAHNDLSFVSFVNSADGTTNNITVYLSLIDFINCGFKRVNNGNTYIGVIIYYNTDLSIAYVNSITIKALISSDGKTSLSIVQGSDSITIISTSLMDESLFVMAELAFFQDQTYQTKKNSVFSNSSTNYFQLKLINSAIVYNLTITSGSLESDSSIYFFNLLNFTMLKNDTNVIDFSLNFSQVPVGTYQLNLFFMADLLLSNHRILQKLASNSHFKRILSVSNQSTNVSNSSMVWIQIKQVGNGNSTINVTNRTETGSYGSYLKLISIYVFVLVFSILF